MPLFTRCLFTRRLFIIIYFAFHFDYDIDFIIDGRHCFIFIITLLFRHYASHWHARNGEEQYTACACLR